VLDLPVLNDHMARPRVAVQRQAEAAAVDDGQIES
jgi:hypothetical protein